MTAITERKNELQLIATSNLTRTNGDFDYTLDYESLIDRSAPFMDNSFLMMLKVLMRAEVTEVALAGLDGYSSANESNYFMSQMEYEFLKQKGEDIMADVNKNLQSFKGKISLNFITPTLYRY